MSVHERHDEYMAKRIKEEKYQQSEFEEDIIF